MACSRIQYKVLIHVYLALKELSPGYPTSTLERYVPPSQLRSADRLLLTVPRKKLRQGDRAFSKVRPVLWNGLPCAVRNTPSIDSFKRQLKQSSSPGICLNFVTTHLTVAVACASHLYYSLY